MYIIVKRTLKIMTKTFFIILTFFSYHIYGQDFKIEFAKSICECAEEEKEIKDDTLENCFVKMTSDFQPELDKMIDTASDVPKYDQSLAIVKQLFFDMQNNLMQNCDVYYEFLNKTREETLLTLKNDFPESDFELLNAEIEKNKTTNLLWARGSTYLALNKLELAEKDFKESLEIDQNYIRSIFFLGWVNEIKGDYQKAIELYEKTMSITNKQDFLIFIELAKRNSKS